MVCELVIEAVDLESSCWPWRQAIDPAVKLSTQSQTAVKLSTQSQAIDPEVKLSTPRSSRRPSGQTVDPYVKLSTLRSRCRPCGQAVDPGVKLLKVECKLFVECLLPLNSIHCLQIRLYVLRVHTCSTVHFTGTVTVQVHLVLAVHYTRKQNRYSWVHMSSSEENQNILEQTWFLILKLGCFTTFS